VYLNTLVKVPCEGPEGAVCSGRLLAGPRQLATAAGKTIGPDNEVVLWMRLTREGRSMVSGAGPKGLRALVETTLEGDGPACRRTSPAVLVPRFWWSPRAAPGASGAR